MAVPLDGSYDISIDRILVSNIFRYEFLKINQIDLNGSKTKHIFDSFNYYGAKGIEIMFQRKIYNKENNKTISRKNLKSPNYNNC